VNLRRLECFIAVAETGSVRAAARRLHVTPPSLSQQLRVLEDEIGGPLLERLPRGMRLTAAGRALLPEARAAVLAAQSSARSARAACTGSSLARVIRLPLTNCSCEVSNDCCRRWIRSMDLSNWVAVAILMTRSFRIHQAVVWSKVSKMDWATCSTLAEAW